MYYVIAAQGPLPNQNAASIMQHINTNVPLLNERGNGIHN